MNILLKCNKMKVDGIFFDLGFTLIEIKDFQVKKYTNLLKKGLLDLEQYLENQGIIGDSHIFYNSTRKIQKKIFKKYFAIEEEYSTEFMLKESFSSLNIPIDDDIIKRSAEIYHKYELKAWKLKFGVKDTLKELSQDYKLAIISNAIYHKGILQILKNLDILKFFDFVLSSAKIGFKKPNKIIFQTVLDNLKLNPNSCLFVGDDIHADIYGAQTLNFKTVQIERKFILPSLKEVNITPDFKISRIPDLLEIINKL